jgi:hypothetical protein
MHRCRVLAEAWSEGAREHQGRRGRGLPPGVGRVHYGTMQLLVR